MRGGATISDVAAAAGVSRTTVSRVMNGSRVDPDLTRRVRAAAEALSYRPSVTARSLSLGRTLAVGIVVPDLTNPMFQSVLRAVAEGADSAGYSVVVAETADRNDREGDIARATRARCDALVLVSPRSPRDRLVELLGEVDPVVLVNRPLPESDVPSVGVDYSEAMVTAVRHLVDLGHRRILYLSGPESSPSNVARLDGLGRARLAFPDVDLAILPCGQTLGEGSSIAHAVLATGVTAVVAYNDLVAFGLVAALNELGVPVPSALSVVGLDGIELSRFATPPLTTVRVPYERIGQRAWQRLYERVGARSVPAAGEPQAETLPTVLVEAGSTGPAPS